MQLFGILILIQNLKHSPGTPKFGSNRYISTKFALKVSFDISIGFQEVFPFFPNVANFFFQILYFLTN